MASSSSVVTGSSSSIQPSIHLEREREERGRERGKEGERKGERERRRREREREYNETSVGSMCKLIVILMSKGNGRRTDKRERANVN